MLQVCVPVSVNRQWEFWALLVSDQHHDNPKARHDLELKHLKQARERGAAIISCGDTFCTMQGKYDKRASKSALRLEHQVDHYLDALVSTAAEFYAPFSKKFVLFGVGNHEQSITDRHESRLIDRLVAVLNDRTGFRVHVGGYSGWVVFDYVIPARGRPLTLRVALHFDHGYGGGGPVTHDAIQHQRRAVYLPDADLVVSGHTHDAWVKEVARLRLAANGTTHHDIQTHVKLSTYKEEYGDGFSGWHVTTGKPPKPPGGWWLRFYFERPSLRVRYEVIRAQQPATLAA